MVKRRRGRPSTITGRFRTHAELLKAVLKARRDGIPPAVASPDLGITKEQYYGLIRKHIDTGAVEKMTLRGEVVIRRLGHVEVITNEELAALLMHLDLIKLYPSLYDVVERLRALTKHKDVRVQKGKK